MKALIIALAFPFITATAQPPQHTATPHGMVYGVKPSTAEVINASKLAAFMGTKTRISTTIKGLVLRVTKTKGGWFDIDAGNGKVIAAHFSKYDVTIPADLKGKYVIAEGVAAKQFIADDLQHMAGDTVSGKKQHTVKTNPKEAISFEVKGLMIDK